MSYGNKFRYPIPYRFEPAAHDGRVRVLMADGKPTDEWLDVRTGEPVKEEKRDVVTEFLRGLESANE